MPQIPIEYLNRDVKFDDPYTAYKKTMTMAGQQKLGDLLETGGTVEEAIPIVGKYDPNKALEMRSAIDANLARQQIEDAKIDVARAKLLLSTGTKADVKELQQLWKDNKRFMTNIAEKYGTSDSAYLEAEKLQTNLEAKLKSIAPEIWGEPKPKEKGGGDTEYTEEEKLARAEALKQFKNTEVTAKVVDVKPEDGIPDNRIGAIKDSIRDYIKDNGYGDREKKNLLDLVDELKKDIVDDWGTKQGNKTTAQDRAHKTQNQKFKIGDKIAAVGMIMSDIHRLEEKPDDMGSRENLLTSLLRKESGAAIAADEVVTRMKGSLPPDARKRLEDKLTGLGKIAKGFVSDDWSKISDQQALFEYVKFMDIQKFMTSIKQALNPEAVKAWRAQYQKDDKPKGKKVPPPASAPAFNPNLGTEVSDDDFFGS